MVKIKIGKWGNLKDLSISISPMQIGTLLLTIIAIINRKDLLPFLNYFLTHYAN